MGDREGGKKRELKHARPASVALVVVLLLLGLGLAFSVVPTSQAKTYSDHTVSGTEIWTEADSPHVVEGYLRVASGGHLILDPGVEVQIQYGEVFEVQTGGMLTAEGTAADPITITAISGQFIGLRLWSGGHTSLAYCDISQAGRYGDPAVDIQATDVTLDHCTIHESGAHGVEVTGVGLSPGLANTTIEYNTGRAIQQSTIDMTPVYTNLTFAHNGTDAVVLSDGIGDDLVYHDVILDGSQLNGSPFIALEDISIESGGHLTLTAGTNLLMPAAHGLWVDSGGALTADGTASDPVVLTAQDPAAPFVKLCFLPGSVGNLTYFDLSRAGAMESRALDVLSSDVELSHCTIHDNVAGSTAGLYLQGAGLSPTIANTTIENNSGRAVQQTTIDMTPDYTNLTLRGNGTDAVVLDKSPSSGSLNRGLVLDGRQLNGRPFISLQQINVWNGAHLTLAPGTELRMSASKAIFVEPGGTLTAEGTAAQPVILTSTEPGTWWLYVKFRLGSAASLAYCDVSRAGVSGNDALVVEGPDVSLSHCIIHDNAASGVHLSAGAGSPLLDNVVLMDNGLDGLRVESGVVATLRQATIVRNSDDGVHISDGGTAMFTNTIIADNGTGIRVVDGGSATLAHTLWDGNGQDVVGVVDETGRVDGQVAFGADGYHLTSSSAALQQGLDAGVLDDIDGEARPQPAGTAPDLGADEHNGSLRTWQKGIDGTPWEPAATCTVEISDTVEIVDVVQAEPGAPFTLVDTWTAGELALADYRVEPSGTGDVTLGSGMLTWEVGSGHPETMTLTKQLHVEPGPWTEITLEETLEGLDVLDPSRPVTFERLPRHDVAVVGVSPSGKLLVGAAASVQAELYNAGTETERDVPVQCIVEGPAATLVYSETRLSGEMVPASWGLVAFPAWTPDTTGVHTLTCQSMLPNDVDPSNDVYTQVITTELIGGADVWTKDNAEDTGDVPSGHPWWNSPDIWVRHQPDGGTVHQNPIVFADNTVYVRLRNRGQQAASGEVAVYWSRSRIGWPCKVGSPNVGTIHFDDLAPGEVRIVSLPWAPQEPGRHGLHTVIEADGDPAGGSALCSPHWPRWDNNVSWRNTIAHFRAPVAGQRALAVEEEQVRLVNVYAWPREVDLIAERESFPVTGSMILRLGEDLFDRWQGYAGHWSAGVAVVPATKEILITDPISATVGGIPMAAGAEVTATLAFDAPETGACQVELYEQIGDLTVGGVAYNWLVTDLVPPQVLAHSPAGGATEVALDAPLVITFDEEMGPLTFDLTLAPELAGWRATWNETSTVVTVTHPSFTPAMRYVAEVMARDAFANAMTGPAIWSFVTREGWAVYLPLVVRVQ